MVIKQKHGVWLLLAWIAFAGLAAMAQAGQTDPATPLLTHNAQ